MIEEFDHPTGLRAHDDYANACALAVAHASALRVSARPISAAALLRPVVLDVAPSVAEDERPGPVDKMPSREF